jgi:hypothetical protein
MQGTKPLSSFILAIRVYFLLTERSKFDISMSRCKKKDPPAEGLEGLFLRCLYGAGKPTNEKPP